MTTNGKSPVQFSAEVQQLISSGLQCADILESIAADAAEGGAAPDFVDESRAAISSFHRSLAVVLTRQKQS